MFIYNLPFGPKTLQQPPATTEPYVYVYDESSWKEDKVVEFRELFVIHNFRYLSKPKRTVHTNLLGKCTYRNFQQYNFIFHARFQV